MELKFYLQADANFQGQLRVREYYDGCITRPDGKVEHLIGLVDDGIKAQNSKEYALFSDYVAKNDTVLYEQARAVPGKPLYFDYSPKQEVATDQARLLTDFSLEEETDENPEA